LTTVLTLPTYVLQPTVWNDNQTYVEGEKLMKETKRSWI